MNWREPIPLRLLIPCAVVGASVPLVQARYGLTAAVAAGLAGTVALMLFAIGRRNSK
jgi:hypothetical protein